MPNLLRDLLPYALAGIFLLAVILLLVAFWYFRRSRRDPYWLLRRNASRAGVRVFLVSLALFGIVAVGCLSTGVAAWIMRDTELATATPVALLLEQTDTPAPPLRTATVPPTASAGPVAAEPSETPTHTPEATTTSTRMPSSTPRSPTATMQPSATSSPMPTVTPTVTPTTSPVVPRESGVLPGPNAELTILGVAGAVDADLQLLGENNVLEAGAPRIYFSVSFAGMTGGMAWERALFRDGVLVLSGAYLWNAGEAGDMVNFFGLADGFPAGDYEIRLYLAGKQVADMQFSLVE